MSAEFPWQFNALCQKRSAIELLGFHESKLDAPMICCNILNGGWHAYTNPVLSEFHEYILVSKSSNPEEVIAAHNAIQLKVKERLIRQPKVAVAGNPVNIFKTRDNKECIEFLLDVCESLGVSDQFSLMIDASGGDLYNGTGYSFSITDNTVRSREELFLYWMGLIRDYKLAFLEDPFHENDYENWHRLTTSQDSCRVIGDNFYATDAERIREGAIKKFTHGVIINRIKPVVYPH